MEHYPNFRERTGRPTLTEWASISKLTILIEDYIDSLAKLNVVIEHINSTCITVIGDFNANLSKHSMFGDMLLNFCNENNVDIVVDQPTSGKCSRKL